MADGTLIFDTSVDTSGVSTGLKSIGSVATKGLAVAGAAVTAATGAMVAFGKSAVDAGSTFDSSMSQVAATMGYSVEELNDSTSEASQTMESLRSFAQEMGSTTAFSASQAADALNYMALAGYDAQTSMDMLPTVLNLAAAGGMELAQASDMVTDVSSALGLSLEETTAMVDQMATASSKSNTSVAQLGDALLTIGATASNCAGGTQELTTVLGALADNGIKGAEGGTHLRNILLSLQDACEDGSVDFGAFSVAVYDAEGNMRNTVDIIKDMQANMEGMDQASKDAIVSGVFNKADLASVNALLNTSADRFDELGAAIGDAQGSAEAMANVQLDNLEGDITLFKSALEGCQIAVADQLTPSLREFVQFGSSGLTRLTQAFQEGGLSGAMDEFGNILSEGLAMIIEMLPDVIDAGMQLLQALIQGIVDNLPQILDATMQIIQMLAMGIIENLPMLIEAAFQIIVQLAMGIAEALPTLMPTIVETIVTIVTYLIENIDMLIDAAIAIITALAEGIVNSLPILIEKAPEIIAKLLTALVTNIPKLLEAAVKVIETLAKGLITNVPKLVAKVPQIMTSLKNAFLGLCSGFADVGKNIIDGLWNGIQSGWSWLTGKVKDLASSLLDAAKGALGINSPSKEFRKIGEFCVAGFDQGIDDLMDGDALAANINASLDTIQANTSGGIGVGGFTQVINVNREISTPDELARAVRLESRYGLMKGVAIA